MSLSDSNLVQLVTLSHTHSIIPNLNSGLVDYESGSLLILVMIGGFATFIVSSLLIHGIRTVRIQKIFILNGFHHLILEKDNLYTSLDYRNSDSNMRNLYYVSCERELNFFFKGI